MRQAIGEIRTGLTTHFVTSGTWSCYELLKYALKTTGEIAEYRYAARLYGYAFHVLSSV